MQLVKNVLALEHKSSETPANPDPCCNQTSSHRFRYEEEDILFPYWSFVNTRHLRTFYEETPWESKLDTAVWRGSPTGVANDWMHLPRTSLVQRCSKPPLNTVRPSNSSGVHQTSPLCDAHFTNYKVGSSSLSSEMESVLGSVAPSIPSPTLSR